MIKINRSSPSEATIQAELYGALKAAGLRPILEQNLPLALVPGAGMRGATIRVDVLLVDERDFAFAAVEVKAREDFGARPDLSGGRQNEKYRRLGLPFRYCLNLRQIAETVIWCASQARLTHSTPRNLN